MDICTSTHSTAHYSTHTDIYVRLWNRECNQNMNRLIFPLGKWGPSWCAVSCPLPNHLWTEPKTSRFCFVARKHLLQTIIIIVFLFLVKLIFDERYNVINLMKLWIEWKWSLKFGLRRMAFYECGCFLCAVFSLSLSVWKTVPLLFMCRSRAFSISLTLTLCLFC